jgi:cell division protein FtsB
MASILAKLLALVGLKLNTVYIALAALGVFAGTLWFTYYQGRQDGYAVAQRAAQKELERQIAVNQEIQTRFSAELDKLAAENDELDQEMEKLREEADRDPGAAKCGIGPDSVRRLNGIN